MITEMAPKTSSVAVLQLVLLPVIWNRVMAIDCFECYSFNKSNPNCGDPFHPAFGHLKKYCTQSKDGVIGEFPAKYCIKLIGTTSKDGIEMVYRGCSIETLDSQCSDFTYEDVRYHGCVMSCLDNGCNNSLSLQANVLLLIAMAVFSAVWNNRNLIVNIV